jgi:hypothetical protein
MGRITKEDMAGLATKGPLMNKYFAAVMLLLCPVVAFCAGDWPAYNTTNTTLGYSMVYPGYDQPADIGLLNDNFTNIVGFLNNYTNEIKGVTNNIEFQISSLTNATNNIQTQVDVLKVATNNLQTEIDTLNDSTQNIVSVFSGATNNMVADYQAGTNNLQTQVSVLQNHEIAVSNVAQRAYDLAENVSNAVSIAAYEWISNSVINVSNMVNTVSNLAQNAYDTGIIVSNWGDHALVGYLTAGSNVSSLVNDSGYITATGTNGLASLIYVDGAVSNWSYYVAKSNVNMAGLAITNMTSASMETGIVDVIYRKNGYKLMDSSALYWDNPLTGYSVVFDSGALVTPSSGTSLDWQNYHLTNGEWKVSNAANEGHEIVNWNVLTGTKISSSTNSDTANVASNLTETATNSLMTLASNSFAHGSLTMGYLVSSNNTNEIVWFGDFQRPLTITNLGWFSTVGSATGIVFLADNATAPSAWDSICYTGLAFAAQARSNAAVSIDVTAGQRIGFMCAPCTNPTVFLGY